MPDVSLMKPLCDVLGITINELLSGEKIEKKDYQEKSEFNFLNTMDYTDRKIKKKNTLLKIIMVATIVLAITAFLLVYLLPVTRGYFSAGEEIEIFHVIKTLPIAPDGESLVRYESGDFIDQDITEKIDMERLMDLLPLMRVTVYKEQIGRLWVGDTTYEIFGYFKSGPRAGKTFQINLGDDEGNYLRHHAGNCSYRIMNSEAWMDVMEMLEGWESDHRENFQWEDHHEISIYYQGALHSGQSVLREIPKDAQFVNSVLGISDTPDEELECSFGTQGRAVYTWEADGETYLGIQVDAEKAFAIAIDKP